jgi:hypothetical protein
MNDFKPDNELEINNALGKPPSINEGLPILVVLSALIGFYFSIFYTAIILSGLLFVLSIKEISNEKKPLTEEWAYLALCYTCSFNFFKYNGSNNFDYHIFLNSFDPLVFIISILLYFGIFRYAERNINRIILSFLLFSLLLYLLFNYEKLFWILFQTILVIMLLTFVVLFFCETKKIEYKKNNTQDEKNENIITFIVFFLILCTVPFQKNDKNYYNLYSDNNKNQCKNIEYNFDIITNSNKSGFVVIDSFTITTDQIIAYLILRNNNIIKNDFKVHPNDMSYNGVAELLNSNDLIYYEKQSMLLMLIKQEGHNMLVAPLSKIQLLLNSKDLKTFGYGMVKKLQQDQELRENIKLESIRSSKADIINIAVKFKSGELKISDKTLDIIEEYLELEKKERFFYYKCE